jgi:hypothetical protein
MRHYAGIIEIGIDIKGCRQTDPDSDFEKDLFDKLSFSSGALSASNGTQWVPWFVCSWLSHENSLPYLAHISIIR